MNDNDNKKIMADNIKWYMERKGVANQQLCDDLGFKYTTFMDWIKGEAMADYFGILKSDLIEDKPKEHREMQEKNDTISDVVIRMQTDEEFMSAVLSLYNMEREKLASLLGFLK